MTRDASECPDLETLAAYLDGRLNARERAEVTAHLAECADCYFVFTEAAQTHATKQAVEPKPQPSWWPRPRVMWPAVASALAAAATVWLTIGTGAFHLWRGTQPELQALVAAVGTDRTIEPRLTGGFAYGPLRGPVRGAGDPSTERISPDVRIAAALIEKDAGTSRTQDAMRLLGVSHLLVGDVDRAIALLEAAANESTADARTFSDLSAAYLVRAAGNRQPDDLSAAMRAADHAIAKDRNLAEAWFNRADALERASRFDEARDAWRAYLSIDAQSGWADEARVRLQSLQSR
jgi:tetratricopeptide (TPR) repeat protein